MANDGVCWGHFSGVARTPGAGATLDTTGNALARQLFGLTPACTRPDRLFLFTRKNYWHGLRSVQLFATEAIEGQENLWPSAHYGLAAVIELGSGPTPSSSVASNLSAQAMAKDGRDATLGVGPDPSSITAARP